MKINKGFSSVEILITLFFICIILACFSFYVQSINKVVSKYNKSLENQNNIESVLNTIYTTLKDDKTPESNSLIDEIWSLNNQAIDNCKIEIQSLSGLLDINTIQKDILQTDFISSLFYDSTELLIELRNKNNYILCYEQIKDLLTIENYEKYFTTYGIININTCDDTVLKNYLFNNKLSDDILYKKKNLYANNQFVKTETEADLYYGVNYQCLKPFVSINAPLNIQTIEPELLECILSIPKFKISGVNNKVKQITELRQNKELSKEDICNILGISNNDELYYYFDVITYFWKFTVSCNSSKAIVIILKNDKDYYIINKKWI